MLRARSSRLRLSTSAAVRAMRISPSREHYPEKARYHGAMARWLIALIIAIVSLVTYFGSTSENPITGEKQRVALKPEEEIALGLKSAPEMAAQMGGLSRNAEARALVERVGATLVRESVASKSPYKFSFHVLADPKTTNAFA